MVSPRRSAQIGLFAAVAFLLAGLTVLFIGSKYRSGQMMLLAGKSVPAVRFSDLAGHSVDLASMEGQVTVLYFTSTRCPISNAYAARVYELAGKFAAQGDVRFLAVHRVDGLNDEASIREIRAQTAVLGQPFPTLLDPHGEAAQAMDVSGTPTFCVLGTHGKLRYAGPFDDNRDAKRVKIHHVEDVVNLLVQRSKLNIASATPPASTW